MLDSGNDNSFDFVEHLNSETVIRLNERKPRKRSLTTPLMCTSMLAVIVLYAYQKWPSDKAVPPVVIAKRPPAIPPPIPPTVTGGEQPSGKPNGFDTDNTITESTPAPEPPPTPPASVSVSVQALTPDVILQRQGLTLVDKKFLLADQEREAYAAVKEYKGDFENAVKAGQQLYNVESRHQQIQIANKVKANLRFENDDLNLAMDSVYRICGPRVRSLNSDQMVLHYQELMNRQGINQLNRLVESLHEELASIGVPRDRAHREFEEAFASSRSRYADVSSRLESISQRYAQLARDEEVRSHLAEYNKANKSNKTLGPSKEMSDSIKVAREHRKFY